MNLTNSVGAFRLLKGGWRLLCWATASTMLGMGSAMGQGAVPGTVSNLVANVRSPGGTTIHLTWESATDAQSYEVWRAPGEDFSKAELVVTNGEALLRYDDDLTRAGALYTYSVRGVNSAGAGSFAEPVVASQTNLLWAIPFGMAIPVVSSDGTVIAAGPDAMNGKHTRITACDRDGSRLWNYQDNDFVIGGPALTGSGQLVFASYAQGGSLRALNHAGQLAWTAKIGIWLLGDAAVDSYGTAYVLANDATSASTYRLWVVSADGVLLWKQPCSGSPPDHAVLGQDGRVYVAALTTLSGFFANGDCAYFLDRRYTQRQWGTPSLNDAGQLVLGSFYGIRPSYMKYDANGTMLVSNQLPSIRWQTRREPAIAADGDAYFIGDNTVLCIATNGVLRWTNQFQTPFSDGTASVPALDEARNVYVAGKSELVVIDHDGQTVKQVELASSPNFPPVLTSDGRLYVVTGTRLYALAALAGLDGRAPWPMYRHDPAGTACSVQTVTRPNKPDLFPPKPYANKVRIECLAPLPPAAMELFRSSTPDFAGAILITRGRAGEAFADDTTAIPGTVYYYWARFQNAGGTSEFSGPVHSMAIEVPVKWFTAVSNSLAVPPAIAPDGTIYTCATNNLLALNTDGSIRWQIPGYTGSPLASPDGAVVIRSGNRVCSLSASGTTNWTMEGITAYSGLVPAIGADGRTVLNRVDDEVMAVSASGSKLWQITYTNYYLEPPSIAADGSIVFLRGSTLIWLTSQGSEARALSLTNEYYQTVMAPVLDEEGTSYLPCAIPSSLSATRADGSNKWRFSPTGGAQTTPILGTDGTVFVGYSLHSVGPPPPPFPGQISALRPDGSVRWTVNSDQSVQGFLALSADGTLLAAAGTNLLALSAEDGTQVWEMNSPNNQLFGAPVLDYDGSLYVPVGDGILALQLKAGPALSAWPMFRQNPRQSACIQRSAVPQIHAFYPSPGHATLEVLAPGGCIILRSADLRTWDRVGFQPPCGSTPVAWTFEAANESVGFFRVLAP
jgi:hypothetical protein